MWTRSTIIFIFTLCIAGCMARPVTFGRYAVNSSYDHIYLDAKGDIYPPDISPDVDKNINRTHRYISGYYKGLKDCSSAMMNNSLWSQSLCDYIKSGNEDSWKRAQQILMSLKSEEIESAIESKRNPVLVILIQGFNVRASESDATYDVVQKRISDYFVGTKKDPVFIRIHWDGRECPGGVIYCFGAWPQAQFTGPLVGFRLRRIFNSAVEKYPNIPVRIMTHSSGAFVAGSLIGDSSAALTLAQEGAKHADYYKEFRAAIRSTNGPYRFFSVPNLRVGMVAPATPPSTFTGLLSNCDEGKNKGEGILINRGFIIFGVNKNDTALQKYMWLSGFDYLGNTQMGTTGYYKNQECLPQKEGLNFVALDFSNSSKNKSGFLWWEAHGWVKYIEREKMKKMLDILFSNLD